MRSKFWITKNSMEYSTRISAKWRKNWQNGGFTCSGDHLTLKMGHFGREGQLQNEGFTCFGDRLTLKMGCFGPHEYRQNGGFTCFGDRLTLKMGRFGLEGQLGP
ncbi:hypothetical protein H5410_029686 [Solanum commersonii]|uniref:Uncharacterized protein n=1 Tax=Solanum commersonii TaxID=4109 RepID=A0A9J5YGF2_SOLCO|nr:hypothetical protein H5410_029686 [Solanum commersonii]